MHTDAVLDAFGIEWMAQNGGTYHFYLDAESGKPLSVEFYTGWAEAVRSYSRSRSANKVTLEPCVYLNANDGNTLRTLRKAMEDNGARCLGLWVAGYMHFDNSRCPRPGEWEDNAVKLASPVEAPIRIWQYCGDCYAKWNKPDRVLDVNQLNPANQYETLAAFIPAPAH